MLASAGLNAIEFVGLPEARIILAQLVTYMALAPKSNASYVAIEEALADIKKAAVQEVPNHFRDKSYQGAKRLGHGENYIYPHAHPDAAGGQEYLEVPVRPYYRPSAAGLEKVHSERLLRLRSNRKPP
jgi:putative ATPase